MAETIKIGGELESTATGNVVAAASAIKDKAKDKYQSQINAETDQTLAEHGAGIRALNSQNYVTVSDYASLPQSGQSADTVYRVSNYDGALSAVDSTKYSEYAWNGTQYLLLSVKSAMEEVFNVSEYNASGGSYATYTDLADLLANHLADIPPARRKGGMSVKFIQSSDNKYVQYRLTATSWSTNVSDWQGVDNYIESSGCDFEISDENRHSIAQFKNGHIVTKNFNSAVNSMSTEEHNKLNSIEEGAEVNDVKSETDEENDCSISDENGNAIVIFEKGHIKTKNFDSENVTLDNTFKDLEISDENGNAIVIFEKGHIKTKNFNSSKYATEVSGGLMSAQDKAVVNKTASELLPSLLPSYYSEYLQNCANKINSSIIKKSTETVDFFFITDTHVGSNVLNGGKIISKLQDLTTVRKVVWGGDAIVAFGNKSLLDSQIFIQDKYLKECSQKGLLLNVRGNHDYLIMNSSSDMSHGYIYGNNVTSNVLLCEDRYVYEEGYPDTYYYIDDLKTNTRIIVLDTTENVAESTDVSANTKSGIKRPGTSGVTERMARQWNWLFGTALDTDMNVVIISHIPISLICSSSGNANYELREYLRAFKNRRIKGTYDFTNARANLIACIGGHSHVDSQEMNDGILFVATTCDAYPNDNGTTKNIAIDIQTDSRGLGTTKEQVIDYYSFDAINHIVKTIRIGGGKDRFFHTNVIELSVGNTYTITPEYIDAENWFSYNEGNHDNPDDVWPTWNSERSLTIPNDIVSVNNGVVTALKAGGANVIAVSEDNVIELFYFKVL